MRQFLKFAAAALGIALACCADPQPPVGRWQGAYEDSKLIIAARLEIDSTGTVRVSAPNAIVGPEMSKTERSQLRTRLDSGLSESWPSVAPTPLEFDGHAFHKPGGVAPQLEWDPDGKHMTLIYYSGNRSAVRVTLESVGGF